MSRIYKQTKANGDYRSPYYFADYLTFDGQRRRVSTKRTDKEAAQTVLRELLAAEMLAKKEQLTPEKANELLDQLAERTSGKVEDVVTKLLAARKHAEEERKARPHDRKLYSDMVERATGKPLDAYKVRDWFSSWLEGKKLGSAKGTALRYEVAVNAFLESLGDAADKDLNTLRLEHILKFYNAERKQGKRVQTVALEVKVIKSALRAATRQHCLKANPAQTFEIPMHDGEDDVEKAIFTPEQVEALIGAAADKEWKGAIALAYYTGMALGDCFTFRWSGVDWERKVIEYSRIKTGGKAKRKGKKPRVIVIPFHPPLEELISSLPGVDGPEDAFLFPNLGGNWKGSSGRSGPSMVFSRIMERAGVESPVLRKASGEKGRTIRALTFHSLRHSFVTELQKAGVPVDHIKELAGHEDIETTKGYAHDNLEQLRKSVAKLPGLKVAGEEAGK